MLLTIQYPIADLRGFIPNSGRLDKPHWDNPEHEFVRNFGAIRYRKKGGLEGWIGENEICEADNIFSFKKELSIHLQHSAKKTHMKCQFRRLYFDGIATVKFEVGIRLRNYLETHLRFIDAKELIEHILNADVKMRNGSELKLINIGKDVADLYRKSTTSYDFRDGAGWWAQAGNPLLFIEYKTDRLKIPYFVNPALSEESCDLSWCYVPFKGINYRAWFLKTKNDPTGRKVDNTPRFLRLSLLRLNAEHECLRMILQTVGKEESIDTGDDFQYYLNRATNKILRLETGAAKMSNPHVVDLARQAINKISPGQQERIEERIATIRRNIRRKQIEYAKTDIATAKQPEINLAELAAQLSKICDVLARMSPATPAEANDLTSTKNNLEAAKEQAKKNDGKKTIEHLAKVGEWVLDVAAKIGTAVAVDAIKIALQLR